MKVLVSSLLALTLVFCSSGPKRDTVAETKAFNDFLDATFDEFLAMSPEGLTYFGKKEQYDKLNDYTEAFELKMLEKSKEKLKAMKQFDRASLEPQAQVSYDLFKKDLEDGISDFKWKDYGYSVNQQYGVHSNLPSFLMNMHRVDTEKDLQDYISRLNEFKRVFTEVGEQVKRSEKAGIIPPQFVFPYVFDTAGKVTQGAPFEKSKKDSPIFADFKAKLKKLKLPAAKNKDYTAQAEKALNESVKPAYASLIAVMKDLQKRATKDDGAWKFPNGAEYYNLRLKRVTTTDLTADQIHQLGLENVARLRKDMEAVKDRIGFKGDLAAFFKAVRKDPKQYFANTESGKKGYLKMANGFLAQMNKKVPEYFHTVPQTKMEIKAVEKYREASAGKAFYEGPSDDGKRAGVYYVNLRDTKEVPKFEAEALFYHEGIPGHHFQIARAVELRNLPKYRRYNGHTAFTEGWGLYTERLGKEMGGYKDAYSELGRLSMEMVRACRLVVDTGIHSKKWTREKALAYFNENLPVNEGMQVEQVERYIIWPGQATGYMVGMLKIQDLRDKAQAKLGKKFDIRDFHEVVLSNGSVPLDTLEQLVNNYVEAKQKSI